ncbi:DUF7093 family protein [Halorubrum tebenquichense]|uniref:Uncharacterized protein n=1 Tax=Halorubrum tebenquichense DSM 14210 TaxID=1227485 RepID=M0DSF0_9EURY|nr:hypothetical protein [Halorubrum tebenquichense]ELZ37602.1 hypothetical protein C472_07719 [Halorubrum tebenquichense DSM 14210]
MGLRCLLGHDFGEPELRREREEDGDEVVTTVKEVKTCARCGETQIVSENTEVTTMEQLADEAAANAAGGTDPTSGAGPSGGTDRGTAGGPSATPGGSDAPEADADGVGAGGASGGDGITLDEEPGAGSDDAVILDEEPSGDGETESAETGAEPGAVDAGAPGRSDAADDPRPSRGPDPADEEAELLDAGDSPAAGGSAAVDADPEAASGGDADAETDDGVILDGEEESPDDRERGAWPSVDEGDAEGDDRTAWPDHGGEDEGFSAEVGEGGEADVEFGGGLTPEATAERDAESAETEYVEAPDDAEGVSFDADGEGGTGITRGESPNLETAGEDEPTEYYCPECGMVRAADGSSMRAGDICPECKRGYVDERPR